ncbi:HET-domain-containing protein [Paramyrothecium foliicola]|nr:HET-domain-containing protein [Paramyrothecium foliicola]
MSLGTPEKPFLETVAECTFCLDLRKDFLRRQWRSFGRARLPIDSPYSVTLGKLAENAQGTGCHGCKLVQKTAEEIQRQHGEQPIFKNLTLEYLDPLYRGSDAGIRGLSLTLSLFLPAKDQAPEVWRAVEADSSLQVDLSTGPSKLYPEGEWEYRVSTPRYEVYEVKEKEEGHREIATENSPWDSIRLGEPRVGPCASERAIGWVQHCLERCRLTHISCNAGNGSQWSLPTRLLDLGIDSKDNLTANPTLYASAPGQQSEYLCLSHCWGTADPNALKPLETTSDSLSNFSKPAGIPWDRLTTTFREAIIFTRMMRIRYLWIDSLCIVQDDEQDWEREAGRMADIYENATLTLAAAASSHSQGGLLRASDTHLPVKWTDDSNDVAGARCLSLQRLPRPVFFEHVTRHKHPEFVSPLLKRAWVLQERMLSKRTLFFTPLELVFECREGCVTDSGHDWVNSDIKHKFASTVYKDDGGQNSVSNARKDQLHGIWRQMVEMFTRLSLTRENDMLPAMAGIAKRMLIALGGDHYEEDVGFEEKEYLAGLWRETFIHDMLWERDTERVSGLPRVNRNVPTWSWARNDAPKEYHTERILGQLCDVVDVKSEYQDNRVLDSFVSVQSLLVVLSGYLLRVKAMGRCIHIQHNARVAHGAATDYYWGEEGEEQIKQGDELFALPVALRPGMGHEASTDTFPDLDVVCLVLCPVSDRPATFRRVGIFSASTKHLRQHEYIMEGNEWLLSTMRNNVEFAESLIQSDGSYREDDKKNYDEENDRVVPVSQYQVFHADALNLWLFLYGDEKDPKVARDQFFGLPHLEQLRKEMLNEEKRVEEWKRRRAMGEEPEYQRSLITLI